MSKPKGDTTTLRSAIYQLAKTEGWKVEDFIEYVSSNKVAGVVKRAANQLAKEKREYQNFLNDMSPVREKLDYIGCPEKYYRRWRRHDPIEYIYADIKESYAFQRWLEGKGSDPTGRDFHRGTRADREVLCVSDTATQSELKLAYRRFAIKHHPDKGGDAERFKVGKAAYERLIA